MRREVWSATTSVRNKPSSVASLAAIRSAIRVSAVSVAWSAVSTVLAVALGVVSGTGVLVAFGAIGAVDGLGSATLVYHFRHALRHESISDELEVLAHRVVLVGLLTAGVAAVIGGLAGLLTGHAGEPRSPELAIAAVSAIVLTLLSVQKQSIAGRVESRALLSDGHLSGIGAAQAAVALGGIALSELLGWTAMDPIATMLVGIVAISVAVKTWSSARRSQEGRL